MKENIIDDQKTMMTTNGKKIFVQTITSNVTCRKVRICSKVHNFRTTEFLEVFGEWVKPLTIFQYVRYFIIMKNVLAPFVHNLGLWNIYCFIQKEF